MKPRLTIPALVFSLSCVLAGQVPSYDADFTGATMRLDYSHSGGPRGEALAVEGVVADGQWPGSRTRLIDDSGLGQYRFEVIDRGSNRVIYSRGFGSIFGEWETTAEVRSANRTFHESVRFPWPKAPVRVVIEKRDARGDLQPFWSTDVNPRPRDAARRASAQTVWPLFENGPSATKVDVLLVSDGYTSAELKKFHADAERLTGVLFSYEPFKSRRDDFNVRALDLPSERSKVRTVYNVFGLARYVLTFDNQALRNAAAAAPYDVVEILVNKPQYGGGGIFNLQGTVAVDNPRSDYVFVHEFAHNFAGLADEYVGNVTYETADLPAAEPWEPNLTLLRDPGLLKWRDLVDPGTPVPTPASYAGRVGAFEGGGYRSLGLYRPEFECIMGTTRANVGFCRVCQRAISRVIDLDTR